MTSKSTIIVANLDNASTVLSQVQHTSATDLNGDQVTLILRIIDATPSLGAFRNEMMQAAQLCVEALMESKAGDEMLMSTWTFNSLGFNVLEGFVKLEDVTPLTDQNYRLDGITNLYDTVYTALTDPQASIIGYAENLRKSGIRVKATVLVLTDGMDNDSSITPNKIKALTTTNEGTYFCLMAFGTGFAQDAARDMGFPNVREYNASKGELRRMMNEFSKSQVRASQSTIAPNAFFS